MNELISRDAAIAKIEDFIEEYSELDPETGYHNLKWCAMEEAKDVLATLPIVDAAPVIHGRWRDTGSGQECSVCNEIQYGYDSGRFYCPNCGAKMDGE